MAHQAAVELDEEVIGEPLAAIDQLGALQRGEAAPRRHLPFGCIEPRPPRPEPEAGKPVEDAAAPRRALHPAPGPEEAAVAAIAPEHLIAPLAAEHHLEPERLARPFAQKPGGKGGGIGGRIVEGGGDARRVAPEIGLRHAEAFASGADRACHGERRLALIARIRTVIADGERHHRGRGKPVHQPEQGRGIDPAREEEAVRHVGTEMKGDTFGEHLIEPGRIGAALA